MIPKRIEPASCASVQSVLSVFLQLSLVFRRRRRTTMKTLPIVDILRLALDDSAEPEYDVCDVSMSVPFNLN